MADESAIDFVLNLIDQISGPSKSATSSLKGVNEALKSASGGVDGLVKKDAHAWADVMTGALNSVGAAAVNMATSLARSAVSGAVDLGRYAISAASFKRNALAAFTLIEGTPQAAAETYDKIKKIADIAPFETEKVVDTFKTLRSSGFGQQAAEQIFLALSDVSAAGGGGAEALGGLTESITKLKAMGKLNMEELIQISRQGGSAGLTIESILGTLATQRHQTIAQVQQQLSAGKIDSNSAIAAILETVKTKTDKGGALGDATKLFGTNSLEGVISTFKSALRNLFEDIDLGPIVKAFAAVNSALSGSSPQVKQLKALFNSVAADVGKFITQFVTAENITAIMKGLVAAIQQVVSVVQSLWQIGSAVLPVLADAAKQAASMFTALKGVEGVNLTLKELGNATPEITAANAQASAWARTLKVLGAYAGAVSAVWANVSGAVLYVIDATVGFDSVIQSLIDHLGLVLVFGPVLGPVLYGLYEVFKLIAGAVLAVVDAIGNALDLGPIGTELAKGLWQGFSDGIDWIVSKIPGLMDQIPDTVKTTLGIASPSKIMEGLGINTARGFVNGLESVPINDNSLTANIGTSPIDLPSAASGGAKGGDVKVDVHNTFNITSGDPADMQRAAEDGTRSGIAAALDRHAIGQGAVPA